MPAEEGDMRGDGEATRILGNAALGLAVLSLPIGLALVLMIADSSASRIAIGLAFIVSLASIGAFWIWRGIAQSRPLTIAKGSWALMWVIAFVLRTQDSRWWSSGVLGACDDATAFTVAMVVVTPATVSVVLGALAIRDGLRASQSWTIAKGWCALGLGSVLGCLEGLAALWLVSAH